MGDFLNKAEYVATISQYDRKMLEELQQVRSNVEQKQNDLEQQQSKLSGLQETLTSKRDELNSKISSTSGELADYQAQLDRAKAAEEALKLAQNDEVSGSVKADDAKILRQATLIPIQITRIKIIRQHQQIQITQIRTTLPTLILQLLIMVIQLRLQPQMLPC